MENPPWQMHVFLACTQSNSWLTCDFCVKASAFHSPASETHLPQNFDLCTEMYLAVWRDVLEGAIFNHVLSAGRVAQLGVTLHVPGGQFDTGCLGLGDIR